MSYNFKFGGKKLSYSKKKLVDSKGKLLDSCHVLGQHGVRQCLITSLYC